jgi:DNA polymerase III sliding clamp (beta) subunit (PCNA family)
MKCSLNVGELTTAINLAKITIDKKPGADFSSLYLAARKGRAGNNRLVIHSSDSVSRTLIRVNCTVDDIGVLIVDPIRLSSVLDHRDPAEPVHFTTEKSGRVTLRVGTGRVSLSSADAKAGIFESSMDMFPHAQEPIFEISAPNLKSLLDRTADFTYRNDGRNNLKAVKVRAIDGGFEALATNSEVCARASVEDAKSPGLEAGVKVEIPNHAIDSLLRLLARSKEQMVKIILVGPAESPRQLFVRTDEDAFYGTAMNAEQFPAIDSIFNLTSVASELVMPRQAMFASILRSNPYASSSRSGNLIALTLSDESLMLSARDEKGEFEEILPVAQSHGAATTATFPISHLSDILRKAKSDEISLKFGNVSSYNRYVALVQDGATYGASYVVGAAS